MNKFLLFVLFFCCTHTIASQNSCDCEQELDFVVTKLKEIPSFKSQHKNLKSHDVFLANIRSQMVKDTLINITCLSYLQRYLKVVKDQHNYIINRGDTSSYKDSVTRYTGNIDALEKQATSKDNDPVTGVYNLLDLYRVAVIKNPKNQSEYLGVLLSSQYKNWQAGDLKFTLVKEGNTLHANFYNNKHFPWYKPVKFIEGRLYPEQWVQESYAHLFKVNPYRLNEDLFAYKKLNDSVHYVRLGNFEGSNENYSKAMNLLSTLKTNMQSGNLIIDLRNNGGGGKRVSDPFVKFLKSIRDESSVHLIQNCNVGSAAEQFILKLAKEVRLKTYGENTRGTLAYGFGNYASPSIITPCKKFTLGLTKKKYERFLEYETVGIPPTFSLDFKTPWIDQVMAKID